MLMRSIDAYTGSGGVRAALQLLALTFVRPGALRLAKWEEFDLEKEEWLSPAERMKMKREHVVPLPRQAIAILVGLRQFSGRGEIFFHPCVLGNVINRSASQRCWLPSVEWGTPKNKWYRTVLEVWPPRS